MFGGAKPTNAASPQVLQGAGLRVQTSINGNPVPAVLGTNRISGNLIWYGDFQANPVRQGSKSGGKGGLTGSSAKGQTGQYNYQVSMMVGLCVGPLASSSAIGNVWATTSTPETPSSVGGNATLIAQGEDGQAAWSYIASAHPDQTLDYNGLAYFAAANLQLGDSPNLPNFSFEVMGRGVAAFLSNWTLPDGATAWTPEYAAPSAAGAPYSTIAGIVEGPSTASNQVFDTSPAWCVAEIWGNGTWGCGLPYAQLGDLTALATWCQAMGIFFSPALTSQRAARDILSDWLQACIADAFWSQGQLKIMPLADQAVTGTTASGAAITYTPNLTPVMTIDDTVAMAQSADQGPIIVHVADPSDLYNQVAIEYNERAANYNTQDVIAQDDSHIAQYGYRPAPSQQGDFITTGAVATIVVDQLLVRYLGVQATYEAYLRGGLADALEPFDVVALVDPAIGLNSYPVRLTNVEEQDEGIIHITAEDIPGMIGLLSERPVPVNAGFITPGNADPGLVATPAIFELPAALCVSGTFFELAIGVTGQSPNWGGCDVYVSTDGESYALAGTITGASRSGTLTAALPTIAAAPVGATIDTVDTLSVNIANSFQQLQSTTQQGALSLNTACWVDGEILAYQTATLGASAGLYGLSYLVRGAYGSTISGHAAGAQFCRLDGGELRWPFTPDRIGQTIYFKFLSFNTLNGHQYTLDEVEPYAYTIRGTALTEDPPNVGAVSVVHIGGVAYGTWQAVSDPRAIDYEYRQGAAWQGGQVVGRTPLPYTILLGDGTYWLAAHYKVPNGPDLYSVTPVTFTVTNSVLTASTTASYDAVTDGWSGTASNCTVSGGVLTLNTGQTSGSYTIPSADVVNLGSPATVAINVVMGSFVGSSDPNFLGITNVLADPDILGIDDGANTQAIPQIQLDGGAWQNWVGGVYTCTTINFRVLLQVASTTYGASLADFGFTVGPPTIG